MNYIDTFEMICLFAVLILRRPFLNKNVLCTSPLPCSLILCLSFPLFSPIPSPPSTPPSQQKQLQPGGSGGRGWRSGRRLIGGRAETGENKTQPCREREAGAGGTETETGPGAAGAGGAQQQEGRQTQAQGGGGVQDGGREATQTDGRSGEAEDAVFSLFSIHNVQLQENVVM